jgi:excisionase family DNA binding protein
VSALGRGILDALDEGDLAALAERVAPFLSPSAPPADDGWLSTRQAAAYAGCSLNALHRAMAAREVRFEQSCAGGKAWFKRTDIDAWRRGDGR